MPMSPQQFLAEVKQRLPGVPDRAINLGIVAVSKQMPNAKPEQILQELDKYLEKNPIKAEGGKQSNQNSLSNYLNKKVVI